MSPHIYTVNAKQITRFSTEKLNMYDRFNAIALTYLTGVSWDKPIKGEKHWRFATSAMRGNMHAGIPLSF